MPNKKAPNPIDQQVGLRVRMQRLNLGKSQSDLAAALGVTFQQVQKYEKGANRIGASRLQQMATFLQMPIEAFFGSAPMVAGVSADEQAGYQQTFAAFFSSRDGVCLARAFLKIESRKMRLLLIALAEQIADGEID